MIEHEVCILKLQRKQKNPRVWVKSLIEETNTDLQIVGVGRSVEF